MPEFKIEDNNQNHKFEKEENIEKLHEFSKTTSQEIIQKYGSIVNGDVTINMKFFDGNICYTKEEMEDDDRFVEKKEKNLARKNQKIVTDNYLKKQ